MQYKPKPKASIGLVIKISLAVVVSLAIYDYYFSTLRAEEVGSNLTMTEEADTTASPFTPEQIAMLNKIESIKIDDSIFENADFLNLQDWTVELAPEEVGKANPFIPGGAAAPQASTTSRTSTRR